MNEPKMCTEPEKWEEEKNCGKRRSSEKQLAKM